MDETMADNLMYISNNDTQNYLFLDCNWLLKRLGTQLNETTNQNSTIVPKVVKQRIRKRYYKLYGKV